MDTLEKKIKRRHQHVFGKIKVKSVKDGKFVVNLIDPYGKKYLKVRMDLEMDQEKLKQEVDKRMPQFKDTILTLLSSKTFEDINSFEGKIQLRSEIMQMLNQFLRTGAITNIYFIEFIVQ